MSYFLLLLINLRGRCDLNYGAKSFNLKAGGGGKIDIFLSFLSFYFLTHFISLGLTLAEFTIDSGGTDFYDVSRIVGYDVSIVIEPPNTDSWYFSKLFIIIIIITF